MFAEAFRRKQLLTSDMEFVPSTGDCISLSFCFDLLFLLIKLFIVAREDSLIMLDPVRELD